MLKNLKKKLSLLGLITIILVSFSPIALAQNYTSPLDNIKDRLENPREGEEGISVVDYSGNVWGRLTSRMITILVEEGSFTGIIDGTKPISAEDLIIDEDENDVEDFRELLQDLSYTHGYEAVGGEIDEDGNVAEVGDYLEEEWTLSNDDIDIIFSEVNAYRYSGERQIRDTIMGVVEVIRNLMAGLAIIWIFISGVRMIMAQGEESVITEQKRSIIYAAVGLVAILVIDRMIDILYGTPGTYESTFGEAYQNVFDPKTVEQKFSAEVYGIINFIKTIIGIVAILMIVVAGLKTILAQGEEEQITKQRKVILWVIIGLVLLAIDQIIVDNIFSIPVQQHEEIIQTSNVTAIVNAAGRIIQFILGFVGLIALGMLIYGAGNMIANYGNEEMVQKSKKIIKNAIIGIIVIISAYTLVATLIIF